MSLSEKLLFAAAKKMFSSSMGQSEEMASALADDENYGRYRRECLDRVLTAADTYGVPYAGKDVLDLGCFDGAISRGYLQAGARHVIGVDIDRDAIDTAQRSHADGRIEFRHSQTGTLPLDNRCVDSIFCYDVFEHVEDPASVLDECCRVLRPGGKMLIGTWGWYHPFAPHLWSTMPVPWAHVLFSERTVLRTCRRVYQSQWYVPNMHDFDADGQRIPDKYSHETIPTDYLNKYLIRDFDRVFRQSRLNYTIHPERFSSRWARWTAPLLKVPFVKEFFTAYIWVVLERPAMPTKSAPKIFHPEPAAV